LGTLGVKGHSDVTLFSPAGSPGVSDDSVVNSVLGSVTNGGDGVIEVRSISTVVEDTSSVTLEVVVGSINGNASWSSSDGRFQGGDAVVLDGSVGGSSDNTLGFGGFASSGLGNVWVRSLEFHWVGHGILESISFKTTIATIAVVIAINELGFSKLEEGSGLDEVSTLHSSGGGESPAGTTLSLVLDWVNSTFSSPVNLSGLNSGLIEGLFLELSFVWNSSHHSLGLILSHGGEHVVSNYEGVCWVGVDLVVFSILGSEDLHSEGVFFLGSVVDVEVGNVVHESGFDSLGINGRAGDSSGS
jgi:hypothetical protein